MVVGWFVDEEEHYSVVYKFNQAHVWMMDPELGKGVRRMSIKKFLSVWYGPDGPRQRVVKHWMMWIYKPLGRRMVLLTSRPVAGPAKSSAPR